MVWIAIYVGYIDIECVGYARNTVQCSDLFSRELSNCSFAKIRIRYATMKYIKRKSLVTNEFCIFMLLDRRFTRKIFNIIVRSRIATTNTGKKVSIYNSWKGISPFLQARKNMFSRHMVNDDRVGNSIWWLLSAIYWLKDISADIKPVDIARHMLETPYTSLNIPILCNISVMHIICIMRAASSPFRDSDRLVGLLELFSNRRVEKCVSRCVALGDRLRNSSATLYLNIYR